MSDTNLPVDEKTPYLDLPLPFPTNDFLDDVQRLRAILLGLDANAQAVDDALAGIVSTFLRMSVGDSRYLLAGTLGQMHGVAPLGGDALVPLVHLPDTRWLHSTLLGMANGVVPLGPDGKIASQYLSDSMLGAMAFKGGWDASSGTLPMFNPKNGYYWIVTKAGETQLGAIREWGVGDWAVFAGTDWIKVDNTDEVRSVRGIAGEAKKGDVILTPQDLGLPSLPPTPVADRFYAVKNGQWAEITNHMPLFMVAWCPNRNAIWPGAFAYDGQEISMSVIPTASEGITRTVPLVPVVSEALWQSDPSYRGSFTKGATAGMIRLPDFNGKSVGSFGAVVLRGDGFLSTTVDGRIQRSAMQDHKHRTGLACLDNDVYGAADGQEKQGTSSEWTQSVGYSEGGARNRQLTSGPKFAGMWGIPDIAAETRGTNVTGCWVGFLFGAVLNPGELNAPALAARMSAIEAFIANNSNGSFTNYYLHVQDQKAYGSTGGVPVAQVYNTRDLNTVIRNTIPGAILSGNRITLKAGTYYIAAQAPHYRMNSGRMRIQNITTGQPLLLGPNVYSVYSTSYVTSHETSISGRFVLAEDAQIEVQQLNRGSSGESHCMGVNVNFAGENEVFTNAEIWRLTQ